MASKGVLSSHAISIILSISAASICSVCGYNSFGEKWLRALFQLCEIKKDVFGNADNHSDENKKRGLRAFSP
jgi:hypothetical protein